MYLDEAQEWIRLDANEPSRSAVLRCLDQCRAGDQKAANDLIDRFSQQIAFGTAGTHYDAHQPVLI